MSESANPTQDRKSLIPESAFLRIADEWREIAQSHTGDGWLPKEVEEASLACLTILEHEGFCWLPISRLDDCINNCVDLIHEKGARHWADALPWRIMAAMSQHDDDLLQSLIKDLTAELIHHSAGFRRQIFQIGWVLHRRLRNEAAIQALLLNVANTLGFHQESFGLAARILGDGPDLRAAIESFTPPPLYSDQYRRRVAEYLAVGIVETQGSLWKLESALWLRIAQSMATSDLLRYAQGIQEAEE